jgi:hypothetical protein
MSVERAGPPRVSRAECSALCTTLGGYDPIFSD